MRSACGGQLGKSNISSSNLEYINGLGKNLTSSVDLRALRLHIRRKRTFPLCRQGHCFLTECSRYLKFSLPVPGDNPFGLLLAFRPKHPEVRPLQPGTGDPPAVRMSGCTGITFYYFAGKIDMHMLLCFAKKGISIPRSIAAVNQCLYNFIQIRRDMYSSKIYRHSGLCTAQQLLGELIAWANLRSWQQGLHGRGQQ